MLSILQRAAAVVVPQYMAQAGGALQIEALSKRFGAVAALSQLSLTLGEGEIVSVTGPSGAGKSTLARLVSGLETPTHGRIRLGGTDFSALPAQARRVSHMFESYALYPTRTVAENIASPLNAPTSLGRWTALEKQQRIAEVLGLTEMAHLCERLPSQLSGGQKQRVALCRALAQDPSLFVLDEPIGHLDAKLRHKLRGDIRRRQKQLRQGTLWLTPDGIEAMAVADRMVVLIEGVVQQVGTPDEVFARPANVRVARLIGDPAMNVLPVQLQGGAQPRLRVGDAPAIPISTAFFQRLAASDATDGHLLLGLRPSELRVAPTDDARCDGDEYLPATVYAVEPLGKHAIVSLEVGGQRLRAKAPPDAAWLPGAAVTVAFPARGVLAFDARSGTLHSASAG
jgi:ABC-type sugar transport system ATPase subunit